MNGGFNTRDATFAGWYNTCKAKGYTIFCLNYLDGSTGNGGDSMTAETTEDYCLYVDDN